MGGGPLVGLAQRLVEDQNYRTEILGPDARLVSRRKLLKAIIHVVCDGYPVAIEFENTDINYTAENGDWLGEITQTMRAHGYDPLKTGGALVGPSAPQRPAPAPAPQQGPQGGGGGYGTNGRYQDRGAAPRPQGGGGGGWACPFHGDENVGPGYNGTGIECKVNTNNPEADDPQWEWIRLDEDGNPKPDRNGNYWCRNKAPGQRQGGGGGRGGYANRGGGGYRR